MRGQYADLDASFWYNNEGQLAVVRYPTTTHYVYGGPVVYPGPTYTYSFDTLGRPVALSRSDEPDYVKDVVYGPAGEILQMKYLGARREYAYPPGSIGYEFYVETRTYNARLQLTRQSAQRQYTWDNLPPVDLEYRYPAAANNGRISQAKDWVTGEEVNYTYDSLNRLGSAVTTGPEWGLSFGYDGFGNLTSQQVTKGTGYNASFSYQAATNRIATPGHAYDAAGNLTAMPNMALSYDRANRLAQATHSVNGTEQYAYDPWGRRIWERQNGERLHFYGPDGQLLGTFSLQEFYGWSISNRTLFIYFGSRLIRTEGNSASNGRVQITDRLGSVRLALTARSSYYPYGELQGSSTGMIFATYLRSATTNLHYAMNRFYSTQIARFLTPDPYEGSARPADPQSWNRYAYVQGDPVNFYDPEGLYIAVPPPSPGLPPPSLPPFSTWALLSGPPAGPTHGAPPAAYYAMRARIGGGWNPLGDRIDYLANGILRPLLAKALDALAARCKEVFENYVGLDVLRARAAVIDFYDASPGRVFATKTQNYVTGNGISLPLEYALPGTVAYVLKDQDRRNLNKVVVRQDFWTSDRQGATLIHELLHVVKDDHPDLDLRLAKYGYTSRGGGSADITDWIHDGCQ